MTNNQRRCWSKPKKAAEFDYSATPCGFCPVANEASIDICQEQMNKVPVEIRCRWWA